MSKSKSKDKTKKMQHITSMSIKYDKDIRKLDEFILRILERVVIRILGILENKRP